MQTNAPPHYNTNSNTQQQQQQQQQQQNEAFLLNLTPLPTKVSFLTSRETLEGELQLKQLRPNHHQDYSFRELSLSLIGLEERSETNESLQLINHSITLWKPPTTHPEPPPSLSPFRFDLPPDLPQCIHLSNQHGIKYRLTACLTYQDHHQTLKHSSLTIPIHIPSTYSHFPSTCNHPAQLEHSFSLSPVEIKTFSPTPIFVSLSQTLLTHSQPIALQIRIPPPAEQLINDKGLQLRNVRAELRRHIRSRSSPQNEVTTILAISGKSCRFSSSRAVFLRLRLHSSLARLASPGTEGESVRNGVVVDEHVGISRCETLSQTTGLFEVGFSVVVRVQIMAADGTRHDHELVQEVGFVSELPSSPACLGKAREAAVESWYEPDAAPTYFETELRDVQASTSQLGGLDLQRIGSLLDWQEEGEEEEEEEYDGYESFSAMAGQDGPAPPTIDEDESPPPAPDTPPEGLALQLPTLLSSEPEPYLPSLLHPGTITNSNSCHLPHMYSFPLPDSHSELPLHSRPTELDPARPPAYAPGWSSLPLPHHQPSLLPLSPPPVSLESSSAEPPPYVANCS